MRSLSDTVPWTIDTCSAPVPYGYEKCPKCSNQMVVYLNAGGEKAYCGNCGYKSWKINKK